MFRTVSDRRVAWAVDEPSSSRPRRPKVVYGPEDLSVLSGVNERRAACRAKRGGHARVDITNIVKYLNRLEKLRIIRKTRPVNSPKEGRAIYELGDNCFRFWLRFVYPYREEIGDAPGQHLQFIKSRYPEYLGPVFEDFCRKALRVIKSGKFHQLGRWWFRGDEIDIAGLNEKDGTMFLGECKWSDQVNPAEVLEPLRTKAREIRWRNKNRKERFAVFARSFRRRISEPDVELFDLEDLCGALYPALKRNRARSRFLD